MKRFIGPAAAVPLLACLLFGMTNPCQAQAEPILKAFTGARLIDGTGHPATENAVLLVRAGRVVAAGLASEVQIPDTAERIDLAGKTVIPGLVNAHGHTAANAEKLLSVFARYGVTTVVSLGGEGASEVALRDAQDPAAPTMARLFLSGPVLENFANAGQAVEAVHQVAAMKADWVKTRVMDGNMSPAISDALIAEAHNQGLKVAVHVYTLDEARQMLRGGVDVVAHSVRDQPVDAEVLDLMRTHSACLIPTLMRDVSTYVYERTPEFFADPFFRGEADPAVIASTEEAEFRQRMHAAAPQGKADVAMGQRNLKAVHDAGLRVAMGTDSGAMPTRFVGYFEHLEMQLMVDAGLTPMQVIQSATGVAADCMGLVEVGTLEPGKWADFIVLGSNPLEDISNTRTLQSVWMAGNQLPQNATGSSNP